MSPYLASMGVVNEVYAPLTTREHDIAATAARAAYQFAYREAADLMRNRAASAEQNIGGLVKGMLG